MRWPVLAAFWGRPTPGPAHHRRVIPHGRHPPDAVLEGDRGVQDELRRSGLVCVDYIRLLLEAFRKRSLLVIYPYVVCQR
jgi:hypothetical protein